MEEAQVSVMEVVIHPRLEATEKTGVCRRFPWHGIATVHRHGPIR
jgi:hypothetical protein